MACALCDDTGGSRSTTHDGSPPRRPLRLLARAHRARAARRREHPEALSALHARELHRLQRVARDARSRRRGASPTRSRRSARGLLLEGQPGVGKTHLAVAVLKQVIERTGARGLFYDTRDLLRVIRSTYDPSIRTTELEILRPVMTADLLVLDDLGAEKTSEWVEETMNLIVNTRYNERRLTIFTSNYHRHPRRHRSELAAVPHRPPHAVAAARDVRVRRASTAPTTASCRPTAASTISSRCGRCARKSLPAPRRAARRAPSCANPPARRPGRPEMARRPGRQLKARR